jgi:hypothetical protein
LDRRQRDVDDRRVHAEDQHAHAADRQDEIRMLDAICRFNGSKAVRRMEKLVLSPGHGISTHNDVAGTVKIDEE